MVAASITYEILSLASEYSNFECWSNSRHITKLEKKERAEKLRSGWFVTADLSEDFISGEHTLQSRYTAKNASEDILQQQWIWRAWQTGVRVSLCRHSYYTDWKTEFSFRESADGLHWLEDNAEINIPVSSCCQLCAFSTSACTVKSCRPAGGWVYDKDSTAISGSWLAHTLPLVDLALLQNKSGKTVHAFL